MAQKYDSGNYILLYRELMDKAIWQDSTPEQKTILITMLLMAKFKPEKRMFGKKMIVVERGQFVTGLQKIANKCGNGVSIRNVRTALNKFEKYEFLTYETTNKGMLVTIENWTLYQPPSKQGDKQTDRQLTQDRQASDKQVTSNRQATDNYKECNKEITGEGDNGNKENNTTVTQRSRDMSQSSSSEPSPDKPFKFANDHSSIQFQLAALLAKRMKENNPKCRLPKAGTKALDNWCIEIDKMIRIDGREPEDIRSVIEWCQADDFWWSNILSPAKLRKQFDQLYGKMQKPKTKIDKMKQNALRPEIQAWINKED